MKTTALSRFPGSPDAPPRMAQPWRLARLNAVLLSVLLLSGACRKNSDPAQPAAVPEPTQFTATALVPGGGLVKPIGMSVDERGQAWVTESGTGQNDARVSLVTPDGRVVPVLTGFASVLSQGQPQGIGHLLYRAGTLYVLEGGTGKLYTADVSGFKPGDAPRPASSLPSEDIGTFVRAQGLSSPVNSNLYSLAFGPDGNLYLADAGANALIRRVSASRALSVFARLPDVAPATQAVPTGIVYDGQNFLVSTLSGAPFAAQAAKLYQVDLAGVVSTRPGGYTALTSVGLSANNQPILVEYGQFALAPPGWVARTGRVANAAGATLLAGLNLPTDIGRVDARTYYLLSFGDGSIQKLTF